MRIAIATLKSVSPYSQCKDHRTPKETEKESPADYEERTWTNKLHRNQDGEIFIPPMAFKKALDAAAKFSGRQIPNKAKATYTKHFKSGVLCTDPVMLGITEEDIVCRRQMVSSTGDKGTGGGRSVERLFPDVMEWQGQVTFYVLDDTITKDVFRETLQEAGQFIGVGVFRPENGGFYGRFGVEKIDWK